MKFAMEIPTRHLQELSKHTDFDFCLAHLLLRGGATIYTKFYRRQVEDGREVWMDNSFHELGKSLGLSELIRAARMIWPTHIVAEETFNDPVKTFHQISQMLLQRSHFGWDCKVVGTWQGYKKDLERLNEVCDVVALPFRRPRQRVVDGISSRKYHYFGFRTLDEIRRRPPRSLDTSAPLKYAYYGQDLERRERRLSTPPLDFNLRLTDDQLEQTVKNINILKRAAD
ncbi:MAG: hypothetical protein ACWGQW_00920 [bacterium]